MSQLTWSGQASASPSTDLRRYINALLLLLLCVFKSSLTVIIKKIVLLLLLLFYLEQTFQ